MFSSLRKGSYCFIVLIFMGPHCREFVPLILFWTTLQGYRFRDVGGWNYILWYLRSIYFFQFMKIDTDLSWIIWQRLGNITLLQDARIIWVQLLYKLCLKILCCIGNVPSVICAKQRIVNIIDRYVYFCVVIFTEKNVNFVEISFNNSF